MKIKIDNPFRDDTHMSMMRVCQFMCVLTAAIVALVCVILGRELSTAAVLVGALLVPAFGGKAIQAFSEVTNAK